MINWELALMVAAKGLISVFLVLVLLSLIVGATGKIVKSFASK